MFKLSISKIIPLFPTKMYLEFEMEGLKSLGVPLQSKPVHVERSESPFAQDSWTDLTPSGVDEFYYIDNYVNLLSLYREVYYRAFVYEGSDRIYSTVVTPVHRLARHEYLRKRKILYDEEIVLRKFTGIRLAVLKKRHIGERCGNCFDHNSNAVTLSHCGVCGGTGFIDPWYTPFITWGTRLPPTKEVQENTTESANETDYTKFQMLDYPSVNQGDILVDLEVNDRYKVDRVEQTEIRHERVHQEVTSTNLNRGASEYEICVEQELFNIPGTIHLGD